ncbi:uncharacterized protein LOC133192367 [Saccostrea echinata]|uniref:uncharacterized protein LOC133192367 n=1 Tax=Saccostrea echinata TaxID=191078 RepID=UPI002A816D90|nr:uncharacterized protein LOC133192367 [Saccostrea echinata]
MENSEIQLGDKNKQLEFLRNIWKAADSKPKVVKSKIDTTDKCNIDLNSKKTIRLDRYASPHSAESQLITDSEDEDFLENRQSLSYPAKSHAADDDDDEVIHNNFFARDVTPQVGREIFTTSSLPTGLIVVVNSDRSKSEARKSSDDENPPQEEIGSEEDSTTTEASKSGWKDIKAGSMVMLSVSYRHKACRSMDVTDLSNVFYRKSQSGIKYDDEFSDGANDDYDSDHYQTHCHNQQHHCHHQHQHCHHNHQGHHIVCRTHGSSYSGKEEERKEKYPFDYCDVEREPPKSFRTIGGCGTCRNCKTGNMVSTMEQLTETIDCEIHDVVPDGNCLFRSVVDQLRMNGEFHWTARTIRHKAVEFLRENPCHEDGSHLGMFLSTESWDGYLCRMSRDKEWGDQLILRGISSVLGRTISIISAIGSGHNQTTIEPSIPSDDITKKEPLQLGHFDEQHYVSLRKKNWSDTWFELVSTADARLFRQVSVPWKLLRSDSIRYPEPRKPQET